MNSKLKLFLITLSVALTASQKCSNIDFVEYNPCTNARQLVLRYGSCGVELENVQIAASQPNAKLDTADPNSFYILVMVDPDAPSASNPIRRFWRHWVIAKYSGSDLVRGNAPTDAEVLTPYQGPMPPEGSGLHRYQFYLFKQPSTFDVEAARGALVDDKRGKWNLDEFVAEHGLCGSLQATYEYQAERRNRH